MGENPIPILTMAKNKNAMIHELKEFVKNNGKRYNFPVDTTMVLDYYDEYLYTKLIALEIKNKVLVLVSYTEEYGNDTDNLSDFHSDIVGDIYNLVINN